MTDHYGDYGDPLRWDMDQAHNQDAAFFVHEEDGFFDALGQSSYTVDRINSAEQRLVDSYSMAQEYSNPHHSDCSFDGDFPAELDLGNNIFASQQNPHDVANLDPRLEGSALQQLLSPAPSEPVPFTRTEQPRAETHAQHHDHTADLTVDSLQESVQEVLRRSFRVQQGHVLTSSVAAQAHMNCIHLHVQITPRLSRANEPSPDLTKREIPRASVTRDSPKSPIKCEFQGCDRPFSRPADLQRHINDVHLQGKAGFKCRHCNYRSARNDKMKEHCKKKHGDGQAFDTVSVQNAAELSVFLARSGTRRSAQPRDPGR